MMRIKLFGLFIAFALLALVRPRKCLELLEAADAGAAARQKEDLIARQNALVQRVAPVLSDEQIQKAATAAVKDGSLSWLGFSLDRDGRYTVPVLSKCHYQLVRAALATQYDAECTLLPPGWRCTRAAGHDGPCAAVAK